MSDTNPATPPPTGSLPSAPVPAAVPKRTGSGRIAGCLGRFVSALLVIVITTAITLTAVGYAALTLGYSPQTPAVLGDAQARVATLEAENGALKAENIAVQTQLAGMIRQSGNDREQVDGLREQVTTFSAIGGEVATRLAADTSERATLAADMSTSRAAVQSYATAEAGRAAQLDELRRRSDRIERFLFRLSDIANDTALDLGNGTPTATPLLNNTPTPATAATEIPTLIPPVVPTATVVLPTVTAVPPTITPSPGSTAVTPSLTPTLQP